MRFPPRGEYVYKDCSIRLSTRAMADLMYAIVMTHCQVITSYGVGVYAYDRKQNSYNEVEVRIKIHPTMIEKFEQLTGLKLEDPPQIQLN